MSVTNDAESEPSGESITRGTMALNMSREQAGHRFTNEMRQDLVGPASVGAGCCA